MNRFLFIIVILFDRKKNGNRCCKILVPEKHINQKGKLRYCRKCIFPIADGQAILTEGFHSQYFTGYCNKQNPMFGVRPKRPYWQMKLQINGFLEIDFVVPHFIIIIFQPNYQLNYTYYTYYTYIPNKLYLFYKCNFSFVINNNTNNIPI